MKNLTQRMDRIADKLDATLDAINKQLIRFHGVMGFMAFLVTGLGVVWEIFGDSIKAHWK